MKWIFVVVALGACVGEETTPPAQQKAALDKQARVRAMVDELRPSLSKRSDGLVVEPLPGGGERVGLNGRMQSAALARVGAGGKVEVGCFDEVKGAEAFLLGTPGEATK